jgi:hypothetical protein
LAIARYTIIIFNPYSTITLHGSIHFTVTILWSAWVEVLLVVTMPRNKLEDRKHVERATQKKRARLSKKLESATLLGTVASYFPFDLLTKLPPDSVGKSNNDYGKREFSMNFIEKKLCEDRKKLGSVTVGCYEMEHVSKKFSRTITEETGRCMDYWNAVCVAMRHVLLKNWAGYSDILLGRMRVMALRGARGRRHTDAFKGVTPNFFIPHNDKAKLRLWHFPEFRSSVVALNGSLYIPMGFSEGGGLRMYGVQCQELLKPNSITAKTDASKFLFSPAEVENLQPVGRLPFVVAGMKQKKL